MRLFHRNRPPGAPVTAWEPRDEADLSVAASPALAAGSRARRVGSPRRVGVVLAAVTGLAVVALLIVPGLFPAPTTSYTWFSAGATLSVNAGQSLRYTHQMDCVSTLEGNFVASVPVSLSILPANATLPGAHGPPLWTSGAVRSSAVRVHLPMGAVNLEITDPSHAAAKIGFTSALVSVCG
ncbi:MAG TPA: hypothetical protein VJS68_00485 [Thermoplasmata archaeon]|nr:hypothetical protein [Thermoplasmata archaeon]